MPAQTTADKANEPQTEEVPARTETANPSAAVLPGTRTRTAAIYLPLSTPGEDQTDRTRQWSTLRRYALGQRWDVMEFRERPGRTGTSPVFKEMTSRSRTPKFQVVLVQSLADLGRSLLDLCETVAWLHGLGIRFIALSDELDFDPQTRNGPNGSNFLQMLQIIVEARGKMTSRNLHAGISRAQSLGVHCGRPRRKIPLARARKLLKEGLSMRAVADRIEVPRSSLAAALKAAAVRGVDRTDNRIPESGPAGKGREPGAEMHAQTAGQANDPQPPDVHTKTETADPWAGIQTSARTITAAIYLPLSTAGEDQTGQMSALRRRALDDKWDVLEFRERPGRAGTRPVFNEMLRPSRTPKFKVVLVQSLGDFGRSLADLCETLAWLHDLDIRFIALSDGIDLGPRTENGPNFLRLLRLLVQTEGEMISRYVYPGIIRAQGLGVHCGRPRRKIPLARARKLLKKELSMQAVADRIEAPRSSLAAALKAAKVRGGRQAGSVPENRCF